MGLKDRLSQGGGESLTDSIARRTKEIAEEQAQEGAVLAGYRRRWGVRYRVEDVAPPDLERVLNARAAEGWHLRAVVETGGLRLVLEREVPAAD